MRRTALKKTISLQPDVWLYVASRSRNNTSAFINGALRAHREWELRKAMIQGYKAMATDSRLAEDLALWDTTLSDGFNDEEDPPR